MVDLLYELKGTKLLDIKSLNANHKTKLISFFKSSSYILIIMYPFCFTYVSNK